MASRTGATKAPEDLFAELEDDTVIPVTFWIHANSASKATDKGEGAGRKP